MLNQIQSQVRNTSSVWGSQKVRPDLTGCRDSNRLPWQFHPGSLQQNWAAAKSILPSHLGNRMKLFVASPGRTSNCHRDQLPFNLPNNLKKNSHLLMLLHSHNKLNQKRFCPTTTAVLRSYSGNYSENYSKNWVSTPQPSESTCYKACDSTPALLPSWQTKGGFEP